MQLKLNETKLQLNVLFLFHAYKMLKSGCYQQTVAGTKQTNNL